METIARYLELTTCKSKSQWISLVRDLCTDLGFEQYSVTICPEHNVQEEAAMFCSNFPPDWLETYCKRRFSEIDPVVIHCASKTTPLIWSPRLFSGDRRQSLYEGFCKHGIRSGVTLPMHGPNGEMGMLSMVSSVAPDQEFHEHIVRALPALAYLRDFIFDSGLRFMRLRAVECQDTPLTGRELECLQWCADGKSSWDISILLNCSEASVNFHFSNIRKKFRATTRHQAVIKAANLGLITLGDRKAVHPIA